jgi:iron complex transport system ATP-binding protein
LGVRAARRTPVPERLPIGAVVATVRGVRIVLGGRPIIDGIDLEVRAGEVLALVGPNGAGKSTLLGALVGDLAPAAGSVELCGAPTASWSTVEAARRRAVLPQQHAIAFPFTARDVVAMGRAPWIGTEAEADDEDTIEQALRDAEVEHLADRAVPSLSGGEQARVGLARVLAQHGQLLALDEPTAALDLRHQELVLRIARRRAVAGDAVVAVLHDLGLAAAHADRIAIVDAGRLVAVGPPTDVLRPDLLSRVYRHDVDVIEHPRTGELLIVPRRGEQPLRPEAAHQLDGLDPLVAPALAGASLSPPRPPTSQEQP